MVMFGTVRANGAVLGPLIILAIGLYPVRLGFALGAYRWLGADALWLSFPVSSFANMAHGDRLLPARRLAQGADAAGAAAARRSWRRRRRPMASPADGSTRPPERHITVSARFDRYLVLVWRSLISI